MKNLSNPLILLLLIVLLGAFLRLIHLNLVPNAMGGDELTYILTNKSIWAYGSDLGRNWNPLSVFIFNYPSGAVQAELPYFLNLLTVGPFAFSLFNARIVTALFSIGIIPLMYFASLRLFKSNRAALFAAFLTSINPWNIYIGRTAYEQAPATFFFLAALIALLYFRGKYLLLSIPILILAFYSYIGTKVFFLPFVLICSWYSYYFINKKKFRSEFIIIILTSALLTAFFAFFVLFQGNSRTSDLILPNSPQISTQVDQIRRSTIANPITKLYENKIGEYARVLTTKFFNTLSFNYLFVTGDLFFSVTRHGLFYMIDFIFLGLGIFALVRKNRELSVFLFLLFLAGLIPQLLHSVSTDNFTPHILFLFPIFILVSSYGIEWVLEISKKNSRPISIFFILIYLILLLNFMQIYLFQFPLQGYFDFNSRVLASYSKRASQETLATIYTPHSDSIAEKFAFYLNDINGFSKKPYKFGKIEFKDCPAQINLSKGSTKIIDVACKINQKLPDTEVSIASLKDGGANFLIYNDPVCDKFQLSTYPKVLNLNQFDIEKLSCEEFCKTYIVKQ